ncbi:hypothetical protein [Pseudonocardia sp. TMWB2A]|uniref:hypothetical protein n=1 Tax=Pseudonocardia sp. TMWB2A TaxID=687430 RepID=UPI00307D0D0A
MTAPVNAAVVGQAAELAVRAADGLMTWEAQAPRGDLTREDLVRIAAQLRSAADLLAPTVRPADRCYELTDAGRAAAEELDQTGGRGLLVLVDGGAG